MTLRVTSFRRAESLGDTPFDIVVLDADERHMRRKRITLRHGDEIMVDFEKPVKLGYPHAFGGMTTAMQHPKFSTVLGLLQESNHVSSAVTKEEKTEDETDMFDKLSRSFKNAFKEIF